jgi:hypothetical protein
VAYHALDRRFLEEIDAVAEDRLQLVAERSQFDRQVELFSPADDFNQTRRVNKTWNMG